MNPSIPPSSSQPTSSADNYVYRAENFQRKSGLRDYILYGLVLLFLGSVAVGTVYYFTLSDTEKDALRGKIHEMRHDLSLGGEPEKALPPPKLAESKANKLIDSIMDAGSSETKPPEAAADPGVSPALPSTKQAPVAGVSAYATVFTLRVAPADTPGTPKPTPEFLRYAQTIRLGAVFRGNPGRAMINDKTYRVGDVMDRELGITLVGLNTEQRQMLLKDVAGAEVRVSY